MNKITIIAYHYVRKIKNSKYPQIKGLEISSFKRQLDFLKKNYNIITPFDLFKKKSLPEYACLLTFDDGFKDHINYVLPELIKRKMKACFFPPGISIIEKQILHAHSIHFILASVRNKSKLVSELNSLCLDNGYKKNDIKNFWRLYAKPNRWENKEIIYLKMMIQSVLPLKLRTKIAKIFFKKFVNNYSPTFASELYMNKRDIKKLIDNGMYIGSHTYNHYRLNTLSYKEQEKEINKSLEFLNEIGSSTQNWIMCYPHGAYDKNTISILKKKNCSYGFTTKVGVANLNSNSLTLPRKDTNDFPQ